jgi:hypothetical protein
MTGLERIDALPPAQRARAKRLLLCKMATRFQENRHVSEQAMRHALGFDRADLLAWYIDAKSTLTARR